MSRIFGIEKQGLALPAFSPPSQFRQMVSGVLGERHGQRKQAMVLHTFPIHPIWQTVSAKFFLGDRPGRKGACLADFGERTPVRIYRQDLLKASPVAPPHTERAPLFPTLLILHDAPPDQPVGSGKKKRLNGKRYGRAGNVGEVLVGRLARRE